MSQLSTIHDLHWDENLYTNACNIRSQNQRENNFRPPHKVVQYIFKTLL